MFEKRASVLAAIVFVLLGAGCAPDGDEVGSQQHSLRKADAAAPDPADLSGVADDARALVDRARSMFLVPVPEPAKVVEPSLRTRQPIPLLDLNRAPVTTQAQATVDMAVGTAGGVQDGSRAGISAALAATAVLPTRIVDQRSGRWVEVALEGATDARREPVDDLSVYRDVLPFTSLIARADDAGAEDFLLFEKAPTSTSIAYRLNLAPGAGLRLLSDVVEVLDESGSPVLHMSPPFLVDDVGAHQKARKSDHPGRGGVKLAPAAEAV